MDAVSTPNLESIARRLTWLFDNALAELLKYDNHLPIKQVLHNRQFNRRFLTLTNHYLFEPVACTLASGWEKGEVENQVGNIRELRQFFTMSRYLASNIRRGKSPPGQTTTLRGNKGSE